MNNIIHQFGWLHYCTFKPNNLSDQQVGRIQAVNKTNYNVIGAHGPITGEVTGQLVYSSLASDLPQTGDWVEIVPYDTHCIITKVLPRYSVLARKEAGKKTDKQNFATNIDKAFIVQGLDQDFNPRRLERMVCAFEDAKIEPIIVLNKADLVEDLEDKTELIKRALPQVKVESISALNHTGIDIIEQLLEPFNTYILVGSSGAGKSTLLNTLYEKNIQKTTEISTAVGKGQHTTTSRELFSLPNRSLIIDTAGVREFGLALDNIDAVTSTFTDIKDLAKNCYYADCTHTDEPDCAVIEALNGGQLDNGVYLSFIKLRNEVEHYQSTQQEKKRKGKDLSKLVRNMKRYNIKKRY